MTSKRHRAVSAASVLVVAGLLQWASAQSTSPSSAAPDIGAADAVWRDSSKTPDQRARDLVARLTLEEKISLCHADGTFTSPGLPRFNIPKLWMSDGPQGVREEVASQNWNVAGRTDDFSTAMPADVGLAATFDTDLARAFGNVIGEEAVKRGKNIMLSPGLNIMRTPLNGRNSEYFGEDPWLSSRMAVGFITGMQANGVSSCAKHFALNNQETQRNAVNVHVDERTMREIYLPAFKAAVTEAHVWSVMSAYNRINGQYCSENDFLLTQVLKKDWAFPGLVMTDWGGCHSTIEAANNGLDLEMGSNVGGTHDKDFLAAPLLAAVNDGKVPMSKLDDMAMRNLRVMAATGNLDSKDNRAAPKPLMSPEHIATARKIEEAACVLLKNERNVLPLDAAKVKTVAVIGLNANTKFAHDGNSAQIKTAYEITPLEGITRRAGSAIKVSYAPGYANRRTGRRGATAPTTAPSNADLINAAVDAAKSADVVVLMAGLYRAQDQEGADRPDMNLPAGQAEVIAAVSKANPNTVVILNGGSPSVVEPWISDVPGLLMYWYGGTEGGNALADVLFGDVSPSGHLPCTWPKQLADSPAHASKDPAQYPGAGTGARGAARTPESGPQETYSEGVLVGYRWFDAKNVEPEFPFGFGLSYTTFEISGLTLTSKVALMDRLTAVPADGGVTVEATVKNSGSRQGAQVVQVYVQPEHQNPAFPRPPRELKAFSKIALEPGASGKVTMNLSPASFAYYDPGQHAWVAEAGDYSICVGDSSRNLVQKVTYSLPKTIVMAEGQ